MFSHIPFVYPSNEEIHQEIQPSFNAVKATKSVEVHAPDNIVNDPPCNDATIGDVPNSTNIFDDPPPKFLSDANGPSPVAEDNLFEEILFRERNEITPRPEYELEGHQETPTQEALHDDNKSKGDVDQKSESSTLDTRSSDENIVELFALLELRDNFAIANSKVDKVIQQVAGLDTKLDLVIKSLFEIKAVVPSEHDRANQLDQIISLFLRHTLEEVNSAQHFVDTPNHNFDEMLIILDETFSHLKAQAPTVEVYGSLSKKPDEIPEEPLLPPPSNIFITQYGLQIMSSISYQADQSKDKGKKIATDFK
ncbi:unnamed protein product [Lactuca saligna]|uniref:Uncharacterized protein n=1 Tax=Lactuca saligna TaxID=75948 RepID=A0AA35Z8K8_LACSI|nr:unnamed protein product [Lactuca saligna]